MNHYECIVSHCDRESQHASIFFVLYFLMNNIGVIVNHNNDKDSMEPAQVTYPVKMAVLVRALRNAFGMSQTYLAEHGGSSRPTVNRIETMDKRSPRSDTLENLLQVFRARGVEIMIGDEEINVRFTRKALLEAGRGIAASSDRKDTGNVSASS